MKVTRWKEKYQKSLDYAEELKGKTTALQNELSIQKVLHQELLRERAALSQRNKDLLRDVLYYKQQTECSAIYLNLAAEFLAALSIDSSAQAFKELSSQTQRPPPK